MTNENLKNAATWGFMQKSLAIFLITMSLTTFGTGAAQAQLTVAPGYDYEIFNGNVSTPFHLAFDAAGNLYTGRQDGSLNLKLWKISADGTSKVPFGPTLADPDAVAVDIDGAVSVTGTIWVATGNKLLGFDPGGTQIHTVTAAGNLQQIAFDSIGNLVASDCSTGGRIVFWNGTALTSSGIIGNCIGGVAPNFGAGTYFVSVFNEGKVLEVDATGGVVQIVASGISPGGMRPDALALDKSGVLNGDLFVLDRAANTVERINLDTTTRSEFASGFGLAGKLGALGLAIGPDGAVYVADNSVGVVYRIFPVRDSDDDGIPDSEDMCPGGDDNLDTDGDLVADFCDSCPLDFDNDADGDGVCGNVDICMGGNDADDVDGDLTPDFCDVCPTDPFNDADEDGFCLDEDNCPIVSNSSQIDSDGDGEGDACDPDSDNDGVLNGADNCPFDANPLQEDFDGDGNGDLCDEDFDGDGVIDSADQCLTTTPGDPVNESGCSIIELCPCEQKVDGRRWKSDDAYERCVSRKSREFVEAGLITKADRDFILEVADDSECGDNDNDSDEDSDNDSDEDSDDDSDEDSDDDSDD